MCDYCVFGRSVSARGVGSIKLKNPAEIARAFKADHRNHFQYGIIGLLQKYFGFFKPADGKVLMGRMVEDEFEMPKKMVFAHAGNACQFRKRNIF
jgi:hypothetical protein